MHTVLHYCLPIGQFVKNKTMSKSVQFSYVTLYVLLTFADGCYPTKFSASLDFHVK